MNNDYRTLRKIRKVLLTLLGILLGVTVLAVVIFLFLKESGKSRLTVNKKDSIPVVESADGAVTQDEEGVVSYNGEKYQLKDHVITILCMGVDVDAAREASGKHGNGQADSILMAVLDLDENQMKLIAIPRDTMTELAMYGEDGQFAHNYTGQLCLQYAYGDGADFSCELVSDAVSKLFYGISMDAYCAVKMESIPDINDMVGGVKVTIPEDESFCKATGYKAGDTVTLKGKKALEFVTFRDGTFGSNLQRMNLQKIYLQGLVSSGKEAFKKDVTLPIKLYSSMADELYTSFSIDQVTYLATVATGLEFSEENIYTVKGETREGEYYDEYYPDETALYELILDVFYDRLEEPAAEN